jgi:PAS domain S-box-containing protein
MPQDLNLLDILYRIKDSVVALDNNCMIIYANQTYAELFGLNPADMVGKNVWTIATKSVNLIIRQKIFDAIEKKELKHFEWESPHINRSWETRFFPLIKG